MNCKVCGKNIKTFTKDADQWYRTNTCAACEEAANPPAPVPDAPVGEVTVTEVVFGGHHSDRMEFERGVDAAGNKWVRCRRCGTIHAAVAHSDEIGDGQRTNFTRSEYPWSDWTPR